MGKVTVMLWLSECLSLELLLFWDVICCAEASYLKAVAIVACKDTIPCH